MAGVKEVIGSNLNLVKSMLEEGKTDKEISDKLDISYASYKNYKAKDLAIKAIYNEVKNYKDEEVEEALFKNCIGYKYYEEVVTKIKEEFEGQEGQILMREVVKISNVKKYKGPDLAAQKYWLNNKKSAHWKDDLHKVKNDKELLKLKKKEVESKVISLE